MRFCVCIAVTVSMLLCASTQAQLRYQDVFMSRLRNGIVVFLPEELPQGKSVDGQLLREIAKRHPGDLPVYTLLAMDNRGFLKAEIARLHAAVSGQQASTSDKVRYGIVLFLDWLDTHPQPSAVQDFRGLWEALKWLEAGCEETASPFVGYMLAIAYGQDAPRINLKKGRDVLSNTLQKMLSSSLWRRITETKGPSERPAPEEVAASVPPPQRRVVKYLLTVYRQWLLTRVWVETAEPGKPRVRKQVHPTEEEEQLARYLEQVIARL
jgi:hypothetical protein